MRITRRSAVTAVLAVVTAGLALSLVVTTATNMEVAAADHFRDSVGLSAGVRPSSAGMTVEEGTATGHSGLCPEGIAESVVDTATTAPEVAADSTREAAASAEAIAAEATTEATPRQLTGKWHRLPESPFGSAFGVGAWTGEEMVVIDGWSRRAAGYDPASRRWTTYPRMPGPRFASAAVWIGNELVVTTRRGEHALALALDPSSRSWRELPPVPPALHAIGSAVWTGVALVVASPEPVEESSTPQRPRAAAYYPTADCWVELPDVPGEGGLIALHAAGDSVLAVTGSGDEDPGVVVSILDLASGAWTSASPSGLVDDGNAGVWTGTELAILSRERNNGAIRNSAYDPATDSWRVLDPACRTETSSGVVWTGELDPLGHKLGRRAVH